MEKELVGKLEECPKAYPQLVFCRDCTLARRPPSGEWKGFVYCQHFGKYFLDGQDDFCSHGIQEK